jgi:hypothetical protein
MMNISRHIPILCVITAVLLSRGYPVVAGPVGTAFNYQGLLLDNKLLAGGLYDFQFNLFDANIGGNELGAEVSKPEVNVIDGYFTVELDFGSVFVGYGCWLEVSVRHYDQNDPCAYTVLSPRQKITPTPYALYALGGGGGGGSYTAELPLFVSESNVISIETATGSVNGALSSTDWTNFNNRPRYSKGTAAKIVVGKGSPADACAIADYICDYSEDNLEINEAILAAGKGLVYCIGDFNITGSVEGNSYITLEFAPGNSIRLANEADTELSHYTKTEDCYYAIGAQNKTCFVVKGANMDWEAGADQTKFNTSRHYAGIWLDGCIKSKVEDCEVNNVVLNVSHDLHSYIVRGILITDSEDCSIINSAGYNTGYEGIGISGYCKNTIIDGCRGGGSYAHSIEVSQGGPVTSYGGPANTKIINCSVIPEWGTYGGNDIIVHGVDGDINGVMIANNSAGRISIKGEVRGWIVSNNLIKNYYIYLSNVAEVGQDCVLQDGIVKGNIIDGSLELPPGIHVEAVANNTNAGKITNVKIEDNIIKNARITLFVNSNTNIDGISISGNEVTINWVRMDDDMNDCPIFLYCGAGSTGSIKNIRIFDNPTLSSNRYAPFSYGVSLYQEDDATGEINNIFIANNTITSGGSTVKVKKATSGTIGVVQIENNKIYQHIPDVSSAVISLSNASVVDTVFIKNNLFQRVYNIVNVLTGSTITNLYVLDNEAITINGFLTYGNGTIANDVWARNIGNSKIITENSGAVYCTDKMGIAHGLALTPTCVIATSTVEGTVVEVNAVDKTFFNVNLTRHDGTIDANAQTVYWQAMYKP